MVHFGRGSQVVLVIKNLPVNAGDRRDISLISGSGRSPGEGNSNPLQYSCLENSMHGEAWKVTAHGVANSQTLLNLLREHAHFGRECGGFLQRSQRPAKGILEIQGRCSRTQKHNQNRGRKRRKTSVWPSLSLNRSRPGMRSRGGEIVNVAPESDFSRN